MPLTTDLNHQVTRYGGDVIVVIDSQPVTGYQSSLTALRLHRAGDTVVLSVVRDGQPGLLKIPVVLSSKSEEPAQP